MTCALTYNYVNACGEIGKENDNEVKGTGNQQDYGMRIYDPRLGRFLSADPLIVQEQKYPELSPYQFASNRPIQGIDLDGLEFKDGNGNNVNTDPGLQLTTADRTIINQYANSSTFNTISSQMTPQNYNGATVPMIPLAANANVTTARAQYVAKFDIDGSNASLDHPFYSSTKQADGKGMSDTHISRMIGGSAQMSDAVYNYFVTNAIRYGANAAVANVTGDNSLAQTDKIPAALIASTQAQISIQREDNAFFEFFNPNESSSGPGAFLMTTADDQANPVPEPGTFYVKTFPDNQVVNIPMLPTNP